MFWRFQKSPGCQTGNVLFILKKRIVKYLRVFGIIWQVQDCKRKEENEYIAEEKKMKRYTHFPLFRIGNFQRWKSKWYPARRFHFSYSSDGFLVLEKCIQPSSPTFGSCGYTKKKKMKPKTREKEKKRLNKKKREGYSHSDSDGQFFFSLPLKETK